MQSLIETLESRTLLAAIALFYSSDYVDSASAGVDAEAANLRAELAVLGHSVTTFDGISAPELSVALADADMLAIPQLSNGSLLATLTNSAKTVIRDFVTDGGGILNAGDTGHRNHALLNDLFGWDIDVTGGIVGSPFPYYLNPSDATGTRFAGGPAALPLNSGMALNTFLESGFNPKSVYTEQSNRRGVILDSFGAGNIVYLDWNWQNGGPDGTLDGGWNEVLRRATLQVARPAPIPSAPTGLVANAQSTAINLIWTDTATTETGFRIERATAALGIFAPIGTVDANATTFTDATAVQNTLYQYRVLATNDSGASDPSNTAEAAIINRVLSVSGTGRSDSIGIAEKKGLLIVTINRVTQAYTASSYDQINISTGRGNDLVFAAATTKRIYASLGSGNDTLTSGDGADVIDGGEDNDLILTGAGNDRVAGGLGDDVIYGGVGKDRLFGQEGNDLIYGDGSPDIISGGDGNDTLIGGSSDDTLYGDDGNDILNGLNGRDSIVGGRGRDTTKFDDRDVARISIEVLV